MKKFIIGLITFFAIITISLITILIFFIHKGNLRIPTGYTKAKLVNTQSIGLDDINSILIEYKSDDIMFYSSDTEELVLKEYMSFTPTDDQLAMIKKNGNDLIIKGDRGNFNFSFFGSSYYNYVEIYLPESYTDQLSVATSSGNIETDLQFNLNSFEASSISGDISLNEITGDMINLSSSSGNITFSRIQCQSTFETTSTSGDIILKEVIAKDIHVTTTSGNISIGNGEGNRFITSSSGDIQLLDGRGNSDVSTNSGTITMKNTDGIFHVSSSSGDLKITALSGGGSLETTSGEISLNYIEDIPGNVKDLTLSAMSGDITLNLPTSLHFNFNVDTTSGDIRTPFDNNLNFNKKGNHASGVIGDNPQITVEIKTTSGNIKLK